MAKDQRGASCAAAGEASKVAAAKAANQRVIGESPFSRYVRIMSEVTDIVVPMLRRIQEDVSNLKEDVRHIKTRVSSIEENLVSMNRQIDHFGQRLDRIERRLDLVEV
jgi:hypothetical protein